MQSMSNTAEQALTHHVALVLDNDEGLYNERRRLVLDFLGSDDAQYPHLLGEQLKDWAESLVISEDGDDNLLRGEILSVALAFVDWRKLATDWIEEEQDS